MPKLSFYLLATVLLACHTSNNRNMSQSDNTAEGKEWISLFDGKSTAGWHGYGKSAAGKAWKAEDGVLHFDPSVKKQTPAEGGDIVTNEEYDNFHLKLEWKIAPKGNSGIIFYINESSTYQYPWQTGPEMQVLDNGSPVQPGHPDAKFYTHRAGDLYDLLSANEAVKPAGEWNAVEIVANKGKLDFYMNGQHTLSTTLWDDNWKKMVSVSKFKDMPGFGKYNKGKIALQDHDDEVWFRNIRIRKL
jgi:hypothetical protein